MFLLLKCKDLNIFFALYDCKLGHLWVLDCRLDKTSVLEIIIVIMLLYELNVK